MNTQRGTQPLKGHSCSLTVTDTHVPGSLTASYPPVSSMFVLIQTVYNPTLLFYFFLKCSLVSFHSFFTYFEIHKDPMNPSDPKPSTSILKTRGTMSIISSQGLTLSAPLNRKLLEGRPCALGPPSLIIASYLTGGHMGVSLPPKHPVQASSSTNSHQGHFPHGGTTASF